MHKLTPLALLFATAAASALQPADVQVTTDPAVTLKIERRLGNTSKQILITVNKQDKVTQIKIGAPAPAPVPVPAPPPPSPVPVHPPPAPVPPPVALPTDGYTRCADEGKACVLAQPANVIYGSSSIFTSPKAFVTSPVCSNATFGDPTPGKVKACWMQPTGATTDTSGSNMGGGSGMPAFDASKIPAGQPGASTFNVKATDEIAPDSDSGAFRTDCAFGKMAQVDPIVFPGALGKSHLHTFFGNTSVDENSTTDSLMASGNSTCRGGTANRSAYWVPTLIDTKDGTPKAAAHIGVYYKNGAIPAAQGIPKGLRMIAGDPRATGPRTSSDVFAYRWKCIGGPNNQNDHYGIEIANCDVGAELWSEIFFPACWDGKNLDSPDHKSHMSYYVLVPDPASTKGWFMQVCPASHPVSIPSITFNVVYPVVEKDEPLRWRLASDMYSASLPGGYSSHADWFNGWDVTVSDAWFKNCLLAKKDCHSHLLGDGRMIY